MILIVGGSFQGKKTYAMETCSLGEEDFAEGCVCPFEAVYEMPAVLHFHEFIRRCLKAGKEVSGLPKALMERNPQVVLVVNELGSGVVPVDAFDREYRETVGRLCCALAREAAEVHRVVCGIGTVIKHG